VGCVLVIGILAAMRIGGIDIGPLLAGGAIGGVIIGLALQGSLSNVFAGLLLTLDGNLRVGEMIRFGDGTTATLENVGWRSTSFKLLDSTILVLPNNEFSREKYINLSRPTPITSLYFDCGVSYSENLETVETLALEAAAAVQSDLAGDTKLASPTLRWRFFADGACIWRFLTLNFRLALYPNC
jgi:small conductance mechanosensitive channel